MYYGPAHLDQSPNLSQVTRTVFAGGQPDATPLTCALTYVGTNARGQKYIQITAQDTGSGLQTVTITTLANAIADVGTQTGITAVPTTVLTPNQATGLIVITATKRDQTLGAQIALQITDDASNVTGCDPMVLTISREPGKPATQPASVTSS